MSADGTLREGEVLLGKYRIGPRVGVGGMAVIYRATSLGAAGFERPVVIKAIKPGLASSPQMVRQFIQEASVGAALDHPSVVQVFDLGEHEGRLYMVLEYVTGKDLAALSYRVRRAQRVLSPELVAFIAIDVCKALECAHEHVDEAGRPRPIVHRDISPQNILISRDGHVKLADFGMARALGATRHTAFGVIKGKLSYMSPEQSLGDEIDGRSDLFGLGVVVWETLTGKRLFLTDEPAETIRRVRECQVPPLAQVAPHVLAPLATIVHKSLAQKADDRYQTATEMRQALQAYLRVARRVDAAVLAAVLETYFPPGDELTETAEPSLSYSDERDAIDLDEEDERTTQVDDFVPSLDDQPPDSPATVHTLIMFGEESRKLSEAIAKAKAAATSGAAGTLLGTPTPDHKVADVPDFPLPPRRHTPSGQAASSPARALPTGAAPAEVDGPKAGSADRSAQGAGAPPGNIQRTGDSNRTRTRTSKTRPRMAPFLVSLLIGIPMGIGVGLIVFWLLTR